MRQPGSTRPPREHVAVRVEAAIVARIDALLPLYALPGRAATRSDALRAVILKGLEVEERRAQRRQRRPAGGVGGEPAE